MMKETIDLLGKILTNILTALYEPFGFSFLFSFLAMFFYLYAYKPIEAGKGWKNAMVTWYREFKESMFFRRLLHNHTYSCISQMRRYRSNLQALFLVHPVAFIQVAVNQKQEYNC